ncbi:hypothetical protein [Nocardioides mangrovi]|uniref:Uncharacterized protein n=1 Tax=Nocardioides mangrovi TaxID=2874580 RepID=A0ABS7UJQ6_9ACTN|nr:hypothetical protein [Nocardioides mangrovi]MBZ5741251.1 hypothetical protein [Nocardioides mangrovi]
MNGALLGMAGSTVVAIALTETFAMLPVAAAAYAAAWWVLRLEQHSTRQGTRR